MNKNYIDKKIRMIIKYNNNLYDIAKSNGITILEFDLGEFTNGLYLYLEKHRLILLNNRLSESHKKIVLAHEIGHAILHTKINCAFIKKYTYLSVNSYELDANYFSCRILSELNILSDENLCIYAHEITELDHEFIQLFNDYAKFN